MPKLCDFGIATHSLRPKTCMPFPVGTPGYMPVELTQPGVIFYNHSIDIYNIGLVLAELLTGEVTPLPSLLLLPLLFCAALPTPIIFSSVHTLEELWRGGPP